MTIYLFPVLTLGISCLARLTVNNYPETASRLFLAGVKRHQPARTC